LGLKDAVFSMSPEALAKLFFANATGTASGLDPEAVRRNGPVKVAPSGPQRFATPSGKIEFYSETLAAQGLPALPDWAPDAQGESLERRFPLRLLTAPGYFQSHTAFSGIAALRKKQGAPACVLHPEEAKKRGLEDGQTVELHNDVGVVRLALRVSDEAPPGVAFVPGQRPAAAAGFARAHPDHRAALDEHEIGLHDGESAAREAHREQAPAEGDAAQRLLEDRATHRIVDDVGSRATREALDRLREGLGLVVDAVIGAAALGRRQLLLARGGGDDG